MTVRPVPYEPTQYPMKYRPLGYGVRPEGPTVPEDPTLRRRNRWLILAAALFVTLVLHAGIAFGLDSGRSAPAATPAAAKSADDCEAGAPGGDEVPGAPGSGSDGEPADGDPGRLSNPDELRI